MHCRKLVAYLKFQTTNPAGGRKRGGRYLGYQRLSLDFKPQTPQGDGNLEEVTFVNPNNNKFQTTNPARGRKLFVRRDDNSLGQYDFKPQTPQGDGNVYLCVSFIVSFILFQTTNPARGRKRDAKSQGTRL